MNGGGTTKILSWSESVWSTQWSTDNSTAYQKLKEHYISFPILSIFKKNGTKLIDWLFLILCKRPPRLSINRQLQAVNIDCSIVSNSGMLTEEPLGFRKTASKLITQLTAFFSKRQQELFYKLHYRNHFPHKRQPGCCRYLYITHGATDLKKSQEYQYLKLKPKFNGSLTQFIPPAASFPVTETLLAKKSFQQITRFHGTLWFPNSCPSSLLLLFIFSTLLANLIFALLKLHLEEFLLVLALKIVASISEFKDSHAYKLVWFGPLYEQIQQKKMTSSCKCWVSKTHFNMD